MKHSLKSRVSATILIIVLLTIVIISLCANYFINRQFTDYIGRQQSLKAQIITTSISQQFFEDTGQWDMEYIHAIGMFSLYEGYIVKVYDQNSAVIWDAQAHDMRLCNQIMDEISERMRIQYPQIEGEFTSVTYLLEQGGVSIGKVSISYFGPFFLNENDFKFLRSLNIILLSIGGLSFLLSLIVGHLLASRISHPILKTVEVTKQIADGNYKVRIEEGSDTTELSLLINSVNHMAVSLETLERLRKQLTEDVAHELRTPITILQSYLEAMTEGVWEASSERLQSCYEEVVRIGNLVGDLEKLAKLEGENRKLIKEKLDLYDLIDKTVTNFESEAENKNIKITLRGQHAIVIADRDRLKQVIVNLLTNALKYSKEESSIEIEVSEGKDVVGFYIQDQGIGISAEELPYIFERFYRADKSRNRSTGGAGIGLTIVKSIIDAHEGSVSVESIIDEGSRFTVKLPKEA